MSWSSYRSRGSRSGSDEGRYYNGFPPYVPVTKRRAEAAKATAKAAKDGKGWSPVMITGRKIATTFWGAAWCEHLESYSDYENRLPRGRTYVRNGSVVDLRIESGLISARVQGSSLYTGTVRIRPLAPARWAAIKAACAGKVTSLAVLLQGRLPEEVLRVITNRASGLFPAPSEIVTGCSCPDSAGLCKHLAAVLYGVGARLDTRPELLFLLRGVDHEELVADALAAMSRGAADGGDALDDAELADVFGIEIGGMEAGAAAGAAEPAGAVKKVTPASGPAPARASVKKVPVVAPVKKARVKVKAVAPVKAPVAVKTRKPVKARTPAKAEINTPAPTRSRASGKTARSETASSADLAAILATVSALGAEHSATRSRTARSASVPVETKAANEPRPKTKASAKTSAKTKK